MSRCIDHTTHSWATRATAIRELAEDGWPTGFHQVQETSTCNDCPAFETRYVPGARARSAGAALALYRKELEAQHG